MIITNLSKTQSQRVASDKGDKRREDPTAIRENRTAMLEDDIENHAQHEDVESVGSGSPPLHEILEEV